MHKMLLVCLALALAPLMAQQARAQCPTIPDNSALAKDSKPFGWAPGTKINVYIDTSKLSSTAVSGVTTAINNWSSALTAYNITVTISNVNGLPANPTGNYMLVGTGNSNGFDALTSSNFNTTSRGVNNAQTFFDPTWVAGATQTQITDLMAHEFSHTFWEGDCTSSSCAGTSVSYQNGNTLDGPSQCDKTAIQNTEKANYNSSGSGGGGGSGQGGGEASCSGPPPNDTCSCDSTTGNYICDCDGVAPTCSDGTSAVCFNSSWTCGTVTTSSCVGSPPTCPDGSDAVCDSDNWTCPSNDCTDPCNPSCSDYDPTDPSCGGGCDPTVDPTCGGCDPTVDPTCGGGGGGGGCDTDCCLSVTPCDVACDMVPLQQRQFWTATATARLRTKPAQAVRTAQQCSAVPTQRILAGRLERNGVHDIARVVGHLAAAEPVAAGRSGLGNLAPVNFAALVGDSPSFGAQEAPITIVEFSDFQCPYCKRIADTLSQQVLPKQGSNIRLVYKYFPLPMHAWAQQAAEISECARSQDESAFWRLHDFFFASQGALNRETLEQEAVRFLSGDDRIHIDRLKSCIANHETRDHVLRDLAQGQEAGVHGTPSLFINGIRVTGAQNAELIQKAIEQAQTAQRPANDARADGPLVPARDSANPGCDMFSAEGRNPCLF